MRHSGEEILIAGGFGFLGRVIGEKLARQGFRLRVLSRTPEKGGRPFPCREWYWDGRSIPADAIDGVSGVINLAGEGIAAQPWSSKYRQKLRVSRLESTRALVQAVSDMPRPPEVILQASAMGLYGPDPKRTDCREQSAPDNNSFLGSLCQEWESVARELETYSRLCLLRTGLVLGWGGGALPTLWDIYGSGLGSQLGDGRQWVNWIHQDDIAVFVEQALRDHSFRGAYNLVAPGNLTNREFHKALAQHTPSPGFLRVPGIAVKMAAGARAELLLGGPKIRPYRLEKHSFSFQYPVFESALNSLLQDRTSASCCFLRRSQWVPSSPQKVWEFASDPANLEKITPPSLRFRILSETRPMEANMEIRYSLRLHGIPLRWTTVIPRIDPGRSFIDEQKSGPYKFWSHLHTFEPLCDGTLIRDQIEFKLPLFPLGQILLPLIRFELNKIFNFRNVATSQFLNNYGI